MPEHGPFDQPLYVARPALPAWVPDDFCYVQARMPARPGVDVLAGAAWVKDLQGESGGEGRDPVMAAVVEHWCGEDHGQLARVRTSLGALRAREDRVLTPTDLGVLDPAVQAQTGCPIHTLDGDDVLTWVRGTSYGDGAPTWVPLGQAVVRWPDAAPDDPVVQPLNFSGLAAGRTYDQAVERALAQVVAEDALAVWWRHCRRPRHLTSSHGVVDSWEIPGAGQSTVHVTLAHHDHLAALGAATGHGAAARSRAAAIRQLVCAADLDQPDSAILRAAHGTLPHRPGRDYLAAAGPGYRRALDPMAALQLGLDPVVRAVVPDPPRGGVRLTTSGVLSQRSSLVPALRAEGRDVIVVDLTTADVASHGWHCVRVLVPGLARVGVPAFPHDPRDLARGAQERGWASERVDDIPLPAWG